MTKITVSFTYIRSFLLISCIWLFVGAFITVSKLRWESMLSNTRSNFFYIRRTSKLLLLKFLSQKKTIPQICNKTYPSIWSFKVISPHLPLWGTGRSSIFSSTNSFLKIIVYVFNYFLVQSIFFDIIDRLDFLLHPVYVWYRKHQLAEYKS